MKIVYNSKGERIQIGYGFIEYYNGKILHRIGLPASTDVLHNIKYWWFNDQQHKINGNIGVGNYNIRSKNYICIKSYILYNKRININIGEIVI